MNFGVSLALRSYRRTKKILLPLREGATQWRMRDEALCRWKIKSLTLPSPKRRGKITSGG